MTESQGASQCKHAILTAVEKNKMRNLYVKGIGEYRDGRFEEGLSCSGLDSVA